jgi:thiol-disulfide isomerase/thioredoxin
MEVEANEQGFFTVHGLQTGQHYELIARTKDSSPKLAGRIWAIPPNPRITIWMSSDFATPNTPAAPAAPAIPGQKPNPANALPRPNGADLSTGPEDGAGGQRNRSGADQNADPARAKRSGEQRRAVDILPPVRLSDPPPNNGSSSTPQPRAEMRPQDIVFNPNLYAQGGPLINVPPQTVSRPEDRQAQPSPYASVVPNAAPPVPSCVLTGRQLDNFALYDLNGKRWEYRSHRGRLVLLDFWATYCPPCRAAIPHLKILQDNYGRYGLEIVGIAYESGSFQEQARAVQGVRDRMRINYRLLLGGDTEASACPVRTQFAVDGLPTLVLLDANNRIIWREKGLLDEIKLHDLKLLIESQLRER